MSIFLYSHGGSENHGCEAIVRGTEKIFSDKKLTLYSNNKKQDEKYGLNEIVLLKDAKKIYKKGNVKRLIAALQVKLNGDETYAVKISVADMLKQCASGDIGLSIGGDNYCYPGFEEYGIINKCLKKRKVKTVLWGCSVEPKMINDAMAEDLLMYDLIVARESITFEAIKSLGAKVVLFPDPAFQLQAKACQIPFNYKENKVIGINISPHIINCEHKAGMAYRNYTQLINFILKNTDYKIALIPHVVWNTNDDRKINENLYADFNKDKRIFLVEDHGCEELKYIISKCCMFIGARTHATIAAYSSCVPTLVVGYSVKAKGIAKDLFGTDKNYVVNVQNLKNQNDLVKGFIWLSQRKEEIQNHLETFIPGYIEKGKEARNLFLNL